MLTPTQMTTAVIEFLVKEYDLTAAEATELVEKRATIVERAQRLASFPYYPADQIVQAEKENWPLDRCR